LKTASVEASSNESDATNVSLVFVFVEADEGEREGIVSSLGDDNILGRSAVNVSERLLIPDSIDCSGSGGGRATVVVVQSTFLLADVVGASERGAIGTISDKSSSSSDELTAGVSPERVS